MSCSTPYLPPWSQQTDSAPNSNSATALMMALSRRVSNGSLLQCSGSLSNCPSRRAAEVKRTADASSSSEQVADCMAQQHKDSQDWLLVLQHLIPEPGRSHLQLWSSLLRTRRAQWFQPTSPARTGLAQQRAAGVFIYLHPDTHICGIPLLSPLPQIMENQL